MPSIKLRKYQNSVYVIYSHKHRIFKIFTGVKVEDMHWNLCSPKKNCPNLDSVLTQIAAMETRVLNAFIGGHQQPHSQANIHYDVSEQGYASAGCDENEWTLRLQEYETIYKGHQKTSSDSG